MTQAQPQKGAWLIVTMMFFFMFINFADKAVLGLTAVPIMKELNLTPKEYGLVASSFFLLFAISSVSVGFLVNHIQSRWALFVMGLIWALSQFPVLGSASFATLIACRVALGAGEGPAYAVALHAAYKWLPNEKRTLPTAIISQGSTVGVLVALPCLQWVIEQSSWRWAYGTLGIVGLIWSAVWLLVGREGTLPATIKTESGTAIERLPYSSLIFNPTVLATFVAGFGAYWGLSVVLAWFNAFLITALGMDPTAASFVAAFPWVVGMVFVIAIGWLSQTLLTRGVSSRVARGVLGSACVALGGLSLILMPHAGPNWLKIAMVAAGISVPSVIYVVGQAVISEITPVSQRGAMLAINVATYTTAGILAPYIMGSTVQNAATQAEGYLDGFVICGVITLIAGLIGMAFIRPGEEVRRFLMQALSAKPVPAE